MGKIRRTAVKRPKHTEAQELLLIHLREIKTPATCLVATEYEFCDRRRWRFDVALLTVKTGIEIDGGAWTQGRHTRGGGFIKDMEKLNVAAALGWKVFRFTPQQVLDGTAKEFIEKYL